MTDLSKVTENGKLVSEEAWKSYITGLENQFKDISNTNPDILKDTITNAVRTRATGKTGNIGKIGVLLSGGLDSSFIALILKQLKKDFTCFSVGLEGSPDLENAKKISKHFKFKLVPKTLTIPEVETLIKTVMKVIQSKNVVKIGVGIVGYVGLELAKQHNVKRVFTGLGSEEIFAGYERHAETKNHKEMHEECWRGLKAMWGRDLVRDYKIAAYLKREVLTPFLDRDVINAAMNVHPKHKIKDHKKAILAEIADKAGLGTFAWRKKKAAQYGSQVQKALKKIAKKNGFNYIRDYLDQLAPSLAS